MGSNSDRAKAYMGKREKEASSFSSNSDRARQSVSRRKYGFDTIEDDERLIRDDINSVFGSWTDKQTMADRRSSVESMSERLNAYKQYGGLSGDNLNRITALSDSYNNALSKWDDLSNLYGNFTTKDAYDKAKWGADNRGLTFDEVSKRLKNVQKGSKEEEYLNEYGTISAYKNLSDYDRDINSRAEEERSFTDRLKEGFGLKDEPYLDKLKNARNRFINEDPTKAYEDLSNNEDFNEKSGYIQSDDHSSLYAFLNDDLDYKGEIKYSNLDSDENKRILELSTNPDLKNLKDNANYIYNTQGEEAFNRYLKEISPYLDKINFDNTSKMLTDTATSNPFMAALYTGLADIGDVISLPGVSYDILKSKVTGQDYNPYASASATYNAWSDVTGDIAQKIKESTEGSEILGTNVPSMLYSSLAVSGVQSKLGGAIGTFLGGALGGEGGAAIGGDIYTAMMGSGAYASTYRDAVERGLSPEAADKTALASGIAEGLFEVLSWEVFVNNKDAESIKDIVKNFVVNFATEGSEEFNTDVANAISDALINGGESEIAQNKEHYEQMGYTSDEAFKLSSKDFVRQLSESFIGGGISGGVTGSLASAKNYRDNTKLGKTVDIEKFKKATEGLEETQAKLDSYDGSKASLGVIYKESLSEAEKKHVGEVSGAIREKLTESGTDSNEAKNISNSVSKMLLGEKMSKDEKMVLKSQKAQEMISDYFNESEWIDSKVKGSRSQIESIKNSYVEGMVSNIVNNVVNDSAKESIDINDISSVTTDGDTLTLDVLGQKLDAKDVKLSSEEAKLLTYASLKSSEVAKESYLANYKGQNVESYDSAFNLCFNYGYNQRGLDRLFSQVSSVLSEADATKIYKSGLDSRISANRTAMDNTNRLIDKWSKDVKSGSFDDSSIQGGIKSLDSTQRRLYVFTKALTSLGANVRVINDTSDDSENGSYNRDTNVLTINLSARFATAKNGMDLISDPSFVVSTVAHELTHFMEEMDRASFDSLKMALQSYFNSMENTSWDYLVKKQQEMFKRHHGEELSLKDAESEVIARACEDMLNNPDTMEKIILNMSKGEAKTFRDTVKKIFDKVIEFITNLMKNYSSSSMEAMYLKRSKDAFEDARQKWIDGISNALKVNQSLFENAMSDVLNGTGESPLFNSELYSEDELSKAKDELAFSLKYDEEYMNNAIEMNKMTKAVDPIVMQAAKALRKKTAQALKKVEKFLPEDIEGEVIVGNASYSKSAEHALVCVRSLVNNWFIDEISERVKRPLTVLEQIAASEVLASYVGNDRECQYCYVATDRKEYRATFLKYQAMYEDTFKKAQKNKDKTSAELEYIRANYEEISKKLSNTQTRKDYIESHKNKLSGFYSFLNKRSASLNMLDRYVHFAEDALNDSLNTDLSDFTTDKKMDELLSDPVKGWYIQDAMAYAKGAAQPKSKSRTINIDGKDTTLDYVAYNGSILKMTQSAVDGLNKEYGLRIYSYSDYTPSFILEDMQIVTDAAVRGLKMLAYTKDTGFIKVFAPTGMGINASTFGYMHSDYKKDTVLDELRQKYQHRKTDENRKAYLERVSMYVNEDAMQGIEWNDIKALRNEFSNVGAVFVATNDDLVEWAMAQDWVDVVIPYHLVRGGKDLAKFFDFKDFKKEQGDRKKKNWKATNDSKKANGEEELLKSIPPTIHANDKKKYLEALDKNHLNPRFERWLSNPNYMKLVNETRKAYTEMNPVLPVFGEMEEMMSDTEMEFKDTSIQAEIDRIALEGKYGLSKGINSIEEQNQMFSSAIDEATRNIVHSDKIDVNGGGYVSEVAKFHTMFSDKADVNDLYTLSDEYERVVKENEILKNDVDLLTELIALDKKKTLGKVFDPRELDTLSNMLLKEYKSSYNRSELRHDLAKAYTDIEEYLSKVKTPSDEDWQYVLYKCQNVAQNILSAAELKNVSVKMDSKYSDLANDVANNLYRADLVRELSREIYKKMWTVKKLRTSADVMQEDAKRVLKAHQMQMDQVVEIAKMTAEKKYKKIIENLEKKSEEEIVKFKQFTEENEKRIEDAAVRKDEMDKLVNTAMRMTKNLKENPRSSSVPKPLRVPLAKLLDSITFSAEQLNRQYGVKYTKNKYGEKVVNENRVSLYEALKDIHTLAISNDRDLAENDYSTLDLPPTFSEEVDEIFKRVADIERSLNGRNQFVLSEMSTEDLKALRDVLNTMSTSISKLNKILSDSNARSMDFYAKDSLETALKLPQKKESKWLKDIYSWGQTLPYYAFKRFGKGGQYIFSLLQNGQDNFAFKINEIKEFSEKTYTKEDIKKWTNEVHEFDVVSKQGAEPIHIKMTKAQMMSLYCLSRRDQAQGHIFGGGLRIGKFVVGKDTVNQIEPVNISKSGIEMILNELKKDEKAVKVAEALQDFMSNECAKWGNEITMKRFGIEGFGEKHYFPIKTDPNSLGVGANDKNSSSVYALLNMSFTKKLMKNANKEIEVDDIFDVFAKHTSDMAKYNSFALPLLDLIRWYNYSERAFTGEDSAYESKTLQSALKAAYGEGVGTYIRKFIDDINGVREKGRLDSLSGFMKPYKTAAVGFNTLTALLQPLSYLRARYVMDSKYLVKGLKNPVEIKKGMEMCQKYVGMAIWKDMGFFDMDVSKGVERIIKHDETIMDKITEASLKGAEMGDAITWGAIWCACSEEIKDKTNLNVGSEEFNKAVALRMRDIIYATQVVDSTFTRSQNMRTTSAFGKMTTAFLSEPTVSYNMLMENASQIEIDARSMGYTKALIKNKKDFSRGITTYLLGVTVESLLRGGASKVRGTADDDEAFYNIFLDEFKDQANPINMMPYIKDIWQILFTSYGSTRMDTEVATQIKKFITSTEKIIEGKNDFDYKYLYQFVKAASQISGIAGSNALRELETIWNNTVGKAMPQYKLKHY